MLIVDKCKNFKLDKNKWEEMEILKLSNELPLNNQVQNLNNQREGVYQINLNQLIKLRQLCLKNIKITKFTAGENITHLDLSHNKLTNINTCQQMKELVRVNLQHNKIKCIDALKSNTKIKELFINNNLIQSIQALDENLNLEFLDASCNKICRIDSLKNLQQLEYLFLNNNNINNISSLEDLIQIKHLEISNNILNDISSIKYMTDITILALNNNKITSIEALGTLVNIETLYLHCNKIKTISSLNTLKHVTNIQIQNNKIKDISVIQELPILQGFNASSNKIKDVSTLQNCLNIQVVNLENNLISQIPKLCHQLKMLNLSKNKILSIANLADTEQIQFINLQSNYICEFEQLLKWKKANFEWICFQNILDTDFINQYQFELIKGQNANKFVADLNTKQQLSYKAFKDNYVQFQTEKYKNIVISQIDNNKFGKTLSVQDDKMMFEFGFTQQYENCNRLIFIKCENISLSNSPLNVFSLTLNSCHLKSLEGIQTMRILVVLNISDNQIENLDPLSSLVNIKHLFANNNQIIYMDAVLKLKNLTYINIMNNKISPKQIARIIAQNIRQSFLLGQRAMLPKDILIYRRYIAVKHSNNQILQMKQRKNIIVKYKFIKTKYTTRLHENILKLTIIANMFVRFVQELNWW
ncbi:leucine-rich_repeat domain-containing protein [Hexamita inflata]|uniref:Leucine-rich repeat domain-containing protein n=1 Tax=Hexamita inflata TaxID=28002 RepID=A0AA86Q0V2_9EUKA|nr:leucine-rich repeat domain-containing protein [Hexamita inflata]